MRDTMKSYPEILRPFENPGSYLILVDNQTTMQRENAECNNDRAGPANP